MVNDFLQKYDCEVCRGSLVHDLCMMSKCHWQIICNSSFSIMSAVLNANQDQTILRPSVYPVGLDFQKDDCFAEEWISNSCQTGSCFPTELPYSDPQRKDLKTDPSLGFVKAFYNNHS